MYKKVCYILALVFCFSVFAVGTSAARTGEFETHDVEFRALVPADLFETIEIQLTHKTENYTLKYHLYKANGYFSNVPVHPGEYSVRVSVGNSEPEDFTYIYEEHLSVVPSSTAIPFIVIVDNASYDIYSDSSESLTEGAKGDTAVPEDIKGVENDDRGPSDEDGIRKPTDEKKPNEKDGGSSSGSLFISFLFSVILLVVVGILLWVYKNS